MKLLIFFSLSTAAPISGHPCCSPSPILASCFGYSPGGNNSLNLRAALDACATSFTVDFVPGSDGVWDLEGLDEDISPPTARAACF